MTLNELVKKHLPDYINVRNIKGKDNLVLCNFPEQYKINDKWKHTCFAVVINDDEELSDELVANKLAIGLSQYIKHHAQVLREYANHIEGSI